MILFSLVHSSSNPNKAHTRKLIHLIENCVLPLRLQIYKLCYSIQNNLNNLIKLCIDFPNIQINIIVNKNENKKDAIRFVGIIIEP